MYNIKLAGSLSLSINNNNLWKKNKQFSSDIWSHHRCWYELILSTVRHLREVYKFVVRTHELIAQRGRNSRCEYFYRSLGCQQLTSSSCDVREHFRVARQCYFKCKICKCYHVLFKMCFTSALYCENLAFPKNLCTPLNSCYTEANQQWISSFPADRCGFSSIHPSAIEPQSELRPKYCKLNGFEICF